MRRESLNSPAGTQCELQEEIVSFPVAGRTREIHEDSKLKISKSGEVALPQCISRRLASSVPAHLAVPDMRRDKLPATVDALECCPPSSCRKDTNLVTNATNVSSLDNFRNTKWKIEAPAAVVTQLDQQQQVIGSTPPFGMSDMQLSRRD